MAELMLGQPLFPGESGIDQLVEIIKVLGTPTREQIKTMNPNYMEHKFPQIKPHPFTKVFRPRTPADSIALISNLLEYTPTARLTAPEALVHEFFDELRVEGARLPNGKEMPALFNFTREELSTRPDLLRQLVPPHAEPALRARGIDIDEFVPIPLDQLRISLDVSSSMRVLSLLTCSNNVHDTLSQSISREISNSARRERACSLMSTHPPNPHSSSHLLRPPHRLCMFLFRFFIRISHCRPSISFFSVPRQAGAVWDMWWTVWVGWIGTRVDRMNCMNERCIDLLGYMVIGGWGMPCWVCVYKVV